MKHLTHVEIFEGLYKSVALAKYAWSNWLETDSEMIHAEEWRVFYLLSTLKPEHRPKGVQIVQGHKGLWSMIKKRIEKESGWMSENHYSIPAKKTKYNGVMYDSLMEARTARVLDAMGIEFEAHVLFNGLYTPQLAPFSYTVDFIFHQPQKLKGINELINGLECKGAIEAHDFVRIDALAYFKEVKIWIVPIMLLEFWEREIKKNGKPPSI